MLGLDALLALEITTSTPDALCPPLEEARAAVRARVGEVAGDYRAEFALIRADDGQQSLELLVKEGDALSLRRLLPLDGFGCEDAAQAIALVLERYFDSVESPKSKVEPQAALVPATPEAPPRQDVPSTSKRPANAAPRQERSWLLRAGLLYDGELGFAPSAGATHLPAALAITPHFGVGVGLDGALFVSRLTESVRGQQISASTLQLALSAPLTLEHGSSMLGLGPWAQLRMQRGEGPLLERGDASYRALPGLGGALHGAWAMSSTWRLWAGASFGAQLGGSSSRFVLRQSATGDLKPVLVPQSWFGQAELAIVLAL
jgi:hypothetical protein